MTTWIQSSNLKQDGTPVTRNIKLRQMGKSIWFTHNGYSEVSDDIADLLANNLDEISKVVGEPSNPGPYYGEAGENTVVELYLADDAYDGLMVQTFDADSATVDDLSPGRTFYGHLADDPIDSEYESSDEVALYFKEEGAQSKLYKRPYGGNPVEISGGSSAHSISNDGFEFMNAINDMNAGTKLAFTNDGDGTATLNWTGTPYTDADAVSAINADTNHGSNASHEYFSGSHDALTDVSADDHHARWTPEETRDAVSTFITGGTDISVSHDDAGDVLTVDYTGTAGGGVHIENTDGTHLVSSAQAIQAGTDLTFTDDGDDTVTLDYSGTLEDTRVDVADSDGVVLAEPTNIAFTAAGAASVTVTDDTDGTATVEVSATDTDTRIDVENVDGVPIAQNIKAIQAGEDLTFVDDGDDTVTLRWAGTHYSDFDAVEAVNTDVDHGSTAHHDYFSGSHDELVDISANDHHAKYTDEEAQDAISDYLVGGSGISVVTDDGGNKLTITNTANAGGSGGASGFSYVASGDNSKKVFTIPHGLGVTPQQVIPKATSEDASTDFWVTSRDNTSFNITYAAAPAGGTDNLKWDILFTVGGEGGGLTATKTGDATQTTFSISHGLSAAPAFVVTAPTTKDAVSDYWVSNVGASTFDITYATAPPSGTAGNLEWDVIFIE